MGSDSDWDYPLTEEDLQAIDAAFSAIDSASQPIIKPDVPDSTIPSHSPPKIRRRLPDSLFSISHCSTSRSYRTRYRNTTTTKNSNFQDVKFGGCIVYSRTVKEVERSADELLKFVEAKTKKEGQCVLGLDIEWKPTFRRGVPPGKAAVMQICGDKNRCYVLHIIHSGIPKNLQCLLEDPRSLKVGVCIANDASKVLQDYNITINSLGELSDLANQKLGGDLKKWSLASLTEMVICKQLPKPNKIRLGNWEVKALSRDQLNYAATDAYVSWFLDQALRNLPDPTADTNNVETVAPN